jgi:ABC-type transporter Mla MlaB component
MRTDRQFRQLSNLLSTFSTPRLIDCSRSLGVSMSCNNRNAGTGLVKPVLLIWDENHMFKISTIDTPQERRLVVEGTLTSPWVSELRRTWDTAGASLESRCLVIDLTDATKIDSAGEAALLELMQEGAKFRCSDVLTKHVLKQIAQKCGGSVHKAQARLKQQ